MNKFVVSLAALAAVLVAVPASQAMAEMAPTPGWYAGVGLGPHFEMDTTAKSAGGNRKIEFDPGFGYYGSGGYAWDFGLRAEGEVWHSRANVVRVNGSTIHDGQLGNTDLFVNALYDFKTGSRLTPYVGAGVGVAFVTANNIGLMANNGLLDDTQTEFAYQAIAGVSGMLDKHWSLTADYRYIGTTDPTFDNTLGGSSRIENASHNILVGLRYSFGAPAPVVPAYVPVAPQPAPVAAPKPVVAPVPQSYMVFFDFDKSALTPEATRILSSAAEDFRKGGYVRIVVTGHTDTMGSAPYNKKLSERRAAAVMGDKCRLLLNAPAIGGIRRKRVISQQLCLAGGLHGGDGQTAVLLPG